jgi:hypothetical protein
MPEVSQRAWIVTWCKKKVSVHTTAPVYLGFHKLKWYRQSYNFMIFLYLKNENLDDNISFASTEFNFTYDHVYNRLLIVNIP